jgi:hypothetical protein
MTWRGRGGALRKRYGKGHKKRVLTVFERHQLEIARQTWNMPDAMIGVMGGGMTREEARRVIRELTGKEPK